MLLILILIISEFASNAFAETNEDNKSYYIEPNSYENGNIRHIQEWTYIHIEGKPYERGFQYGYLLSDEIVDMIYSWCKWISNNKIMNVITKIKNEEALWNLYKTKAEQLFLRQIPEEYTEELRGMTNGINAKGTSLFNREVKFEDVLTLQLVQDIYYKCFKYPLKKYHPMQGLVSGLKNFFSKILGNNEDEHCIAFIATGDATKNGDIVIAHSTLFDPLIAMECNIILDVKPSDGNRFMMTTFPGAIWSCEDYYQNEKGIVLTETELPQGPWKKGGVPKGVRSRNAIQYSDNLNDAIEFLMDGNDGLIPNNWLIGDTKTGEIASLEQALFNTPVKRTYNGFYWSCNFPHDSAVKRELYGLSSPFIDISMKIMPNVVSFSKVKKFKEIEKEFYGKIDIDNAKKILSTYPLSQGLIDGKITTSKLTKNMIMIAHFGNPDESNTIPSQKSNRKSNNMDGLSDGKWVEIIPSALPTNTKTSETKEDTIEKQNTVAGNGDFENNTTLFLITIFVLMLTIISYIYCKWRGKK